MQKRGVCYDVGREMLGQNWRPDFDLALVHRELSIIKADLHCNAVRICGHDIGRLIASAEDALQQGFEVWLSPELYDHDAKDTLDYIVTAAAAAEEIRRRWPDQVVFSVGSELSLFMRGILGGGTFFDRIRSPWALAATMFKLKVLGLHNKPLNAFLAAASRDVRRVFQGPIVYASAPVEDVDWSLFDYIGVDYYRGKQNRDSYSDRLKERYSAFEKPVVVTEVGCCTYQGAEDKGGRAFMIVDRKRPDRLRPGYVRDEQIQAREVSDMLRLLDASGVSGAFVFTFVAPTLKFDPDPLFDFDKASFSLVKSYRDGEHGSTYPSMTWEPKEAFHAVAKFYAGH